MFMVIWMVITAPINREIIMTNGMESTPNLLISKTRRLKNSFHLSGILKTWAINNQYLPKDAIELINILKKVLTERQS